VTLPQRAAGEGIGTAFLLATVVGSGIMAERLAGGSAALALLANSTATGAALVALILALAPISGAQLNPVVTLAAGCDRTLPWKEVPLYLAAQLAGAIGGVLAANVMFELPAFSLSQHERHGGAQLFSESVATFGLLFVIRTASRTRDSMHMALAVGGYIAAAYWFTASTSFANPAVTIARCLSDTFAGIQPADVPGFVGAQLIGAAAAVGTTRWLAR
jgi:glycerol uptake facilitator-like aquaporin